MSKVKTIGVLTSGGDAPGMNAAIRAVVRAGLSDGLKVLGIRRGYNGLMSGGRDIVEMNYESVAGIAQHGGTILRTARCLEFIEIEGVLKGVQTCKDYGIDGIVSIGGDGSFRGARDLAENGVLTVGIPATIDNDIACTDYAIGFDTACNTAVELVDKLRDTAQSHERSSVVEVMGRDAGYLALYVGIATGALVTAVPERPLNVQDIIEAVKVASAAGKNHHIIIVAEGVAGGAQIICKALKSSLNMEARFTVLGHVQRGGNPTCIDRVNATRMGVHAVKLLKEGIGNRLVCIKKDEIVDVGITEGLRMKKDLSQELYDAVAKTTR